MLLERLLVNTNLLSASFILLDEKSMNPHTRLKLVKINLNLVEFSKDGKNGFDTCFSLFLGTYFCSPQCRMYNLQ